MGTSHRATSPRVREFRPVSLHEAHRTSSTVRRVPVALLAFAFLQTGCEKDLIPYRQESQPDWTDTHGPFLNTRWGQDGPYAALTPGGEALGCWSVAFAQVLAYHRLQPRGHVRYTTKSGRSIDESLGTTVTWDRLAPALSAETPPELASETARYCYQAAVVLQKDFGRGEYMDTAFVPREISEHYGCRVTRWNSDFRVLKSELASGRPVVAYFNDILDIDIVRNGHAAVLDGYAEESGRGLVHVNFGWHGASDGWYDLARLAQERDLRALFVVVQ